VRVRVRVRTTPCENERDRERDLGHSARHARPEFEDRVVVGDAHKVEEPPLRGARALHTPDSQGQSFLPRK